MPCPLTKCTRTGLGYQAKLFHFVELRGKSCPLAGEANPRVGRDWLYQQDSDHRPMSPVGSVDVACL